MGITVPPAQLTADFSWQLTGDLPSLFTASAFTLPDSLQPIPASTVPFIVISILSTLYPTTAQKSTLFRGSPP